MRLLVTAYRILGMNKLISILSFVSIIILSSNSIAQQSVIESTSRFVEATGSAEIKIPATKVLVTLSVTKTANDAKSALKENSVVSEKVISSLKSQSSVSELSTDTIQLYERKKYDNIKNESITTGYESRNQISFSVDLKSAGEIIDQAINLGANNLLSVSPKAEDSAIEEAKLNAIDLATKKAKVTADKALAALGFKAKDVQIIRVDPELIGFVPGPQPMMEGMAVGRGLQAASTPIEGGTNSVSARAFVRVTY